MLWQRKHQGQVTIEPVMRLACPVPVVSSARMTLPAEKRGGTKDDIRAQAREFEGMYGRLILDAPFFGVGPEETGPITTPCWKSSLPSGRVN
jgi:hypothetical protein